MGAALGIPVVGVCTLDVLAAAVDLDEAFLVATDARRKEVYWARYAASGARHTEPTVDRPDVVATDEPVAGRGATLYPEAFPNAIAPEYPSAADLARLVLSGRRDRAAAGAAVPAPSRRGRARRPGSASHDPAVGHGQPTSTPWSRSRRSVFGDAGLVARRPSQDELDAARRRPAASWWPTCSGEVVGYVVLMVIGGYGRPDADRRRARPSTQRARS